MLQSIAQKIHSSKKAGLVSNYGYECWWADLRDWGVVSVGCSYWKTMQMRYIATCGIPTPQQYWYTI